MIKLHRCIIKFLASAWITNVATFRLQPTCAEAAFSAVSGTPAPNVATFRLQPTCAEAAFLLCPPTLGAPDVWTFVLSLPCLCFVLFCVGGFVYLCGAPRLLRAPRNLRPCAALINLLRLLQQIRFPSAHGIGSRLRWMTLCVVGKGPNVSLSHRWYPRTTSSTPLRAVLAPLTSRC